MFKSIKIKNLRAITELEIDDLGQINLFVGQNSCGKTTFLEAVFFLIGSTNPQLPINANVFRDLPFLSNRLWPTYFHNMDTVLPIEIFGCLRDTEEKQNLLIRPRQKEIRATPPMHPDTTPPGYAASDSETIFESDGLRLEYTSSKDPSTKIESTIFLKGNQLITEGAKSRDIRGIFVNPFTIYNWRDRFSAIQNKKQVTEVISLLKEIEPRISDLRLNEAGLLLADIGLSELIPANLMGGGIAKFLSIALAMLDSRNGIVLIDEIENGLHHSAQKTIWKAIFNWALHLNVQVFATSHSNESIKAFNNIIATSLFETEAKLFRFERKDEKFRAVEYSKDILAESLESDWEVRWCPTPAKARSPVRRY